MSDSEKPSDKDKFIADINNALDPPDPIFCPVKPDLRPNEMVSDKRIFLERLPNDWELKGDCFGPKADRNWALKLSDGKLFISHPDIVRLMRTIDHPYDVVICCRSEWP